MCLLGQKVGEWMKGKVPVELREHIVPDYREFQISLRS